MTEETMEQYEERKARVLEAIVKEWPNESLEVVLDKLAGLGYDVSLVYDDNGNWAMGGSAFGSVSAGEEPEPYTVTFFVEADEFRDNVRDAVYRFIEEVRGDDPLRRGERLVNADGKVYHYAEPRTDKTGAVTNEHAVIPPGAGEDDELEVHASAWVYAARHRARSERTKAYHKARHVLLYRLFDELVADFVSHTHKLPSKTTVLELMNWSSMQSDHTYANDNGTPWLDGLSPDPVGDKGVEGPPGPSDDR